MFLYIYAGRRATANETRNRDDLRDQNALSEDIVNAMTNERFVDDAELEAELEDLQQEELDEQMLKTGNVPVSDAVHKIPTPANTERTFSPRTIPLT